MEWFLHRVLIRLINTDDESESRSIYYWRSAVSKWKDTRNKAVKAKRVAYIGCVTHKHTVTGANKIIKSIFIIKDLKKRFRKATQMTEVVLYRRFSLKDKSVCRECDRVIPQ